MRTYNTEYVNKIVLSDFIDEKSIIDDKLLVQVFSGILDENKIQNVLNDIKDILPNSTIIGATTAGEIIDDKINSESIVISFTIFDKTTLKTAYIENESTDYYGMGQKICNNLVEKDTKVLILFSNTLHSDREDFLKGIESINKELVIAGGVSGDNFLINGGKVFVDNKIISASNGTVGVSLTSKELQVKTFYNLGWKAIGKNMEVTKVEKGRVYTLDNVPAENMYRKYLGDEIADNLMDFAGAEFPIIVERDGVEIAREAISKNEDQSINYSGKLYQGENIKFGYGNMNIIVQNISKIEKELKKLDLESMFIYSCAARKAFLKDGISQEMMPISKISNIAGFFTYGEFFHLRDHNETLNMTLTILCLSEKPFQNNKNEYEYKNEDKNYYYDSVANIKALTHLVDVVTSELNSRNKNLNERNKEIELKNMKIKMILDNVEEGFLLIDENMVVQSEYSKKCEEIFEQTISNKKIESIIPEFDEEEISFLETVFEMENVSKNRIDVFLSLLPKKMYKNEKTYSLKYIFVDSKLGKRLIVIITDITEKIILEKKLQGEKNILFMIVSIISNYDQFKDSVIKVKYYFNSIIEDGIDIDNMEKFKIFLRKIHTYKGEYGQWNMVTVVDKIMELEDYLFDENNLSLSEETIKKYCKEILNEINAYISFIREYVGRDIINFEEDEIFRVSSKSLSEFENYLQTLDSDFIEKSYIIEYINKLRNKEIDKMLAPYKKYCNEISEKMGKGKIDLKIIHNNIYVNQKKYIDFFRSLIHIFKNIIDHGIELVEERIKIGKPEIAKIVCEIWEDKDNLYIKISDDGKGIDIEKLKSKLIESGVITEKQIKELKDKDILEYIFNDNISTRNSANLMSGRGVGLSAVKEEVEKFNGKITVETKKGFGTEFNIELKKK